MTTITLRDLLNLKKLTFTLISVLAAGYFSYNFTIHFNLSIIFLSVFIVTFLSSMQIYFSYFIKDRIIDYYQLPIPINYFYVIFLTSVFFVNLLERLLVLGVIFYSQFISNFPAFIYCLTYSMYVILISFFIFDIMQKDTLIFYKKASKMITYLIAMIIPILIDNPMLLFLLLLVAVFKLVKIKHLIYISEQSRSRSSLVKNNYFTNSLVMDGAFFTNLIFGMVFIAYLIMQNTNVHVIVPLIFTIISINSPIATLISSDRGMLKQIKSLPNSRYIYMMYFRLLLVYFSSMNGFIFLILIYLNIITANLFTVFFIAVLILFESIFSTILEIRFPIKKWYLKKDIWKNPRKYILAAIVYLFTFLFSFLF